MNAVTAAQKDIRMDSNLSLYVLTAAALIVSLFKSRPKTLMALKKGWKSFENILPQFLSVLLLIGFVLSILTPTQISALIGQDSAWLGIFIASVLGSITLIPGFIAFPLASVLLKSGAGYAQIAAFISTLMMVGIVTIPLEIKYFGKKAAYLRNGLAYVFSIIVALVIGALIK